MADIQVPNFVGLVQAGQDRAKDLALNNLAQQAYQAQPGADRDALVGQAIGLNRDQGFGLGQTLQANQDQKDAKLGAAARYVLNAYQQSQTTGNDAAVQGAYQAVRPYLQQLHSASGASTDTPDNFTPDMLPAIYQIVAKTQGATAQKMPAALQTFYGIQDQLPIDQRQTAAEVKAGTAPRAQADKWQNMQLANGDGSYTQGTQNLRTGEIRDLNGNVLRQALSPNAQRTPTNQATQAPTPAQSSGDFYGAMGPIVSQYGGQVTSTTRSPDHNAAVGGVPNSQHLNGTAVDVVVPAAGKAGFIEAANNAGYQAIDEGTHVHVQERQPSPTAATAPSPSDTSGSAIGQAKPGQMGYVPPKQNALQQKIQTARSLGADDDQIRSMVLGPNASAPKDSGLTPNALDNATWDYLLNGKLPPLGRGIQGQAQRTAIMNRGGEIADSLGVQPDELATVAGRNKAFNSSLTAFQKRSDAMQSAEQGFRNNMQQALALSAQVDRTGSPIVNKWVLGGEENLGDPQVSALNAAVRAAATDYARIMSGATGAGGTPISTTEDAVKLIRSNLSHKQLGAVADTLYQDIHGQESAVNNQRQTILGRLRSLGSHQVDQQGNAAVGTTGQPTAPASGLSQDDQDLLGKYGVKL